MDVLEVVQRWQSPGAWNTLFFAASEMGRQWELARENQKEFPEFAADCESFGDEWREMVLRAKREFDELADYLRERAPGLVGLVPVAPLSLFAYGQHSAVDYAQSMRLLEAELLLIESVPQNPNDERDQYVYERAMAGDAWDKIGASVRKHAEWEPLNATNSVKAVALRYADRKGLPKPATRKAGRQPRNTN